MIPWHLMISVVSVLQRVGWLHATWSGALAEEVRLNFQRLRGWRIRGLRWERYDEAGVFL